jgi:hypothetical protein
MLAPRVGVPEADNSHAGYSGVECGYGWFVTHLDGHKLVFHTGEGMGFISYNGRFPDDDVDVVVLAHLEGVPVETIASHLARMVVE